MAYHKQALAIYREINEKFGEETSLRSLGNVALKKGDYHTTSVFNQQALIIAREIWDRRGEAKTLRDLGAAARE